jgi:iron complex outermembrane recepter protein
MKLSTHKWRLASSVSATAFMLMSAMASQALAQDASSELIVTGTRTTGLKALDSAAPVQLVDSASLKRVAQTDLAQALAQNVPSFTAQAFGGDMAGQSLSARLRGVSPNHTLVLINGKRRHGSANLSVLAGAFQGGAAADFSFVPVNSIERIEVLTDGAAAQYGTDAIAGVINIITKKQDSGGSVTVSGGEYYEGDGESADISANIGLKPTPSSFLNLSFVSKYKGYTDRGADDSREKFASNYIGGVINKSIPFDNRIQGDGAVNLTVAAYNYGYKINDTWDLYSFGTYGQKKARSFQNYRTPVRLPTIYPKGFNPRIQSNETDYAGTFGASGSLYGWNIDVSSTYGVDDIQISNYGGANRSLFNDKGFTPDNFFNGAFNFTQLTNTVDVSKEYDVGMAAPLNLAMGIEQRSETFQIKAGDAASYYKEGSQAYPGFKPTDAGKYDRDVAAIYADVALKPIDKLSVDVAVRYEDYSDFGNTTVGKLTSRYDFTPGFAIRGTASSGFRAPTMAEQYYSATNVSPTSAFVQLPPNGAPAKLLGVNGLKPEESVNLSLGFVTKPVTSLTLTVDAYQIKIDKRIIGSGSLYGTGSPSGRNLAAVNAAILASGNVLDPTVTQTGVTLFLNGANTTTTGVDIVLTYPQSYGDWGKVDWSLAAAIGETKVDKLLDVSSVLKAADLFDFEVVSQLEDYSPKYKLIANALWNIASFTVNLKGTLYGESFALQEGNDGKIYKNSIAPEVITDLDVTYKVTSSVKFSVGANNLFDVYPKKRRPDFLTSFDGTNGTVGQYPAYSAYGFNGGYYYAKLNYSF